MRSNLDEAMKAALTAKDIAKANNANAVVDVSTLEILIQAARWVKQYEEREDKTALFERNKSQD